MAILNVKNLPDGLYRKLKARARAERRSVAQEVTHILATTLEQAPPSGRVAERTPEADNGPGSYIRQMRGRATSRLSTDEIMAMTRGPRRK